MKLSGGSSSMSGRTEICYNNVWFGICAYRHSSPYDLNTICRILGYSSQGITSHANVTYEPDNFVDDVGLSSSFFDLPTIPLIPYKFSCSGNEQSLLDCYKYPISCYSLYSFYQHYIYGGVTCQGISDFDF